jgi:hypothetical protein
MAWNCRTIESILEHDPVGGSAAWLGDRAAAASQPELEKNPKHLQRRAMAGSADVASAVMSMRYA